jgi:hypothetical protein
MRCLRRAARAHTKGREDTPVLMLTCVPRGLLLRIHP